MEHAVQLQRKVNALFHAKRAISLEAFKQTPKIKHFLTAYAYIYIYIQTQLLENIKTPLSCSKWCKCTSQSRIIHRGKDELDSGECLNCGWRRCNEMRMMHELMYLITHRYIATLLVVGGGAGKIYSAWWCRLTKTVNSCNNIINNCRIRSDEVCVIIIFNAVGRCGCVYKCRRLCRFISNFKPASYMMARGEPRPTTAHGWPCTCMWPKLWVESMHSLPYVFISLYVAVPVRAIEKGCLVGFYSAVIMCVRHCYIRQGLMCLTNWWHRHKGWQKTFFITFETHEIRYTLSKYIFFCLL